MIEASDAKILFEVEAFRRECGNYVPMRHILTQRAAQFAAKWMKLLKFGVPVSRPGKQGSFAIRCMAAKSVADSAHSHSSSRHKPPLVAITAKTLRSRL